MALNYSMRFFPSSPILLLTHLGHLKLPKQIIQIQIPKLASVDQYSRFMLYDLHKYIDTDYALTIQYDGFVVNPSLWRDDFLAYDYIGAPWEPAHWPGNKNYDALGREVRVGNGGFSLRSKKLLSLPSILKLPFEPWNGLYNEDGFLCCRYKPVLEEHGCNFAPLDIAVQFSKEMKVPENEGVPSFGFHKWSGENSKYPYFSAKKYYLQRLHFRIKNRKALKAKGIKF